MIKLNILNFNAFFNVVNNCKGLIYQICNDGKKRNICREYDIQNILAFEYAKNGNRLPLSLSVQNPADYMAIISYYAGDC